MLFLNKFSLPYCDGFISFSRNKQKYQTGNDAKNSLNLFCNYSGTINDIEITFEVCYVNEIAFLCTFFKNQDNLIYLSRVKLETNFLKQMEQSLYSLQKYLELEKNFIYAFGAMDFLYTYKDRRHNMLNNIHFICLEFNVIDKETLNLKYIDKASGEIFTEEIKFNHEKGQCFVHPVRGQTLYSSNTEIKNLINGRITNTNCSINVIEYKKNHYLDYFFIKIEFENYERTIEINIKTKENDDSVLWETLPTKGLDSNGNINILDSGKKNNKISKPPFYWIIDDDYYYYDVTSLSNELNNEIIRIIYTYFIKKEILDSVNISSPLSNEEIELVKLLGY